MPEPGDARTLEENLSRLAAVNPGLAGRVREAAPDPRFVRRAARSGVPVPAVRSAGAEAPLHSLYDPRKESRRLADTASGSGFLVFCGLGGGFHVQAALEDPRTLGVLVIEKDETVLRALLGQAPYGGLIQDSRVSLAVGLPEIRPALLRGWKPALMGGMKLLPLRAWCSLEKQFFDEAAAEIQSSIDEVRADYGVQSHFGKRWFANTLLNLPNVTLEPADGLRELLARAGGTVVTAAGPSLDGHLPGLRARGLRTAVVATDTSLPALLRAGVQPDAVLSIDCQVYGYHHFLQGLPRRTVLFLDLASPPFLARRFSGAQFVCSAHPLSRWLQARWPALPAVDTSGGNVAHAAVSLARALGAGRVQVYGADFSYPLGKPYARGTYLYDFFQAQQDRLRPADSELVSFAIGNGSLERRGGEAVYTTPVLDGYRRRFQELMEAEEHRGFDRPSMPPDPPDWKSALSELAARLESLPAPAVIARMDDAWTLVLPVAARAVKEGLPPGLPALEEARRWSLDRLRRVLSAWPQR